MTGYVDGYAGYAESSVDLGIEGASSEARSNLDETAQIHLRRRLRRPTSLH